MNQLKSFAEQELDAAGITEDSEDKDMRDHILHMIDEFAKEGHSGFSASMAISILEKLLRYEPLSPLTGDDSEWCDVAEVSGYTLYQNKRCSRVFKEDDSVYDIEGKVFFDYYIDQETGEKRKSYFSNSQSRMPVTFPYTPTTVYEERIIDQG